VQEDIAQAIAASLQVPLGLKQGMVRGRGFDALTEGAALLEQVVARKGNSSPAIPWALLLCS